MAVRGRAAHDHEPDSDPRDDDLSAIVALAKAVNRARIAYDEKYDPISVKIDDAMSRLLELDPSYDPRGGRKVSKKRAPLQSPRIFTLKRIADRLETTVGALLGENGFEITEADRAIAGEFAAWLTEKFRLEPGNSRSMSVKADISDQSENVSPYPPRTVAKWTMAFPVEPNAFNDNGDTDYPLEMHWFELESDLDEIGDEAEDSDMPTRILSSREVRSAKLRAVRVRGNDVEPYKEGWKLAIDITVQDPSLIEEGEPVLAYRKDTGMWLGRLHHRGEKVIISKDNGAEIDLADGFQLVGPVDHVAHSHQRRRKG